MWKAELPSSEVSEYDWWLLLRDLLQSSTPRDWHPATPESTRHSVSICDHLTAISMVSRQSSLWLLWLVCAMTQYCKVKRVSERHRKECYVRNIHSYLQQTSPPTNICLWLYSATFTTVWPSLAPSSIPKCIKYQYCNISITMCTHV